jgi:TusA-related sulfurtransferase
MFSSEDFERLYIRYTAEAMPRGESIQAYCSKNKVPFNLFDKWYKDTHHKVVKVQVEGKPKDKPVEVPNDNDEPDVQSSKALRIMIDIKMTNGMHIQQRNLSYSELKRLIGNLEVLC